MPSIRKKPRLCGHVALQHPHFVLSYGKLGVATMQANQQRREHKDRGSQKPSITLAA